MSKDNSNNENANSGSAVYMSGTSSNSQSNKKGYSPRIFTEDEINSQLQGYIFVIPANWDKIAIGDHIKYLRNDGNFRRGGYVCGKWERGGKKYFHLENKKDGGNKGLKNGDTFGRTGGFKYVAYPVAHEDIKSLFKRVDNAIEIGMIKDDLQRKKDQIEILTRELIALKKKVGELEAGRRKSL